MKRIALTSIQSLTLATAMMGVLIAGSAGLASAGQVGGAAAKATSPADDSCVSNGYGYLTNSCSTSKSFILSLPISTTGTKNISFTGYGATSSNNVSCKAATMFSTGSGYQTSTVSLPAYGSLQTVSLGSLPVSASSTFYLLCTINAGGILFSVQWDE